MKTHYTWCRHQGNGPPDQFRLQTVACLPFKGPQDNLEDDNHLCLGATNTNQRVYDRASQIAYPEGNDGVKPFIGVLDERKIKLAGHILRAPDSDPLSPVTYKHGSAEPRDVGKRRVGRPRQHWTFKSKELIYKYLQQVRTNWLQYEGYHSKMTTSYWLHASVWFRPLTRLRACAQPIRVKSLSLAIYTP